MNQTWIDESAATWFLKHQEGLSPLEKLAFEQWISHVEHQKAYAMYERLWSELDSVGVYEKRTQHKRRTWIQYACATLLLLICVGVFQWNYTHRLEYTQTLATPIGAMKEYTLADGTSLFLDTNTEVDVRYFAHQRIVTLHQGQIALHVHKESERPFVVQANNVMVRVTGTRFEVRYVEDDVRVSVEEGSVDVLFKRAFDHEVVTLASLKAKEQIVVDERGNVETKTHMDNDTIAPWRGGRLIFDKTPLEDVLFEFERYGIKPVMIGSSTLAKMPLSGSFEIERFSSFMHMLPKVLPLNVIHDGNVTRLDWRP